MELLEIFAWIIFTIGVIGLVVRVLVKGSAPLDWITWIFIGSLFIGGLGVFISKYVQNFDAAELSVPL